MIVDVTLILNDNLIGVRIVQWLTKYAWSSLYNYL
jgi:hypothetical protein